MVYRPGPGVEAFCKFWGEKRRWGWCVDYRTKSGEEVGNFLGNSFWLRSCRGEWEVDCEL